jgi:hypothetical protein
LEQLLENLLIHEAELLSMIEELENQNDHGEGIDHCMQEISMLEGDLELTRNDIVHARRNG